MANAHFTCKAYRGALVRCIAWMMAAKTQRRDPDLVATELS